MALAAVDYSVVDAGSLGETATAGNDDCPHRTGVTVLCGQTLGCLHVDNTERLSLAQISDTLLRRFSYNDIHNRRVALDHEQPPEALVHVWGDVKATFNCGKRNGLVASYSAHAGGCSAPEVQQPERSSAAYPVFAPFKSYPINTSHIPYATAPSFNVLLPPTTPLQSGNMWLDHQAGIHPFCVLLNRHLYSSMIQRHAYGMPLLGLHNSAYVSAAPMPSFAQHPDLVAVASPHSAFRSVSAQNRKHEDGIGGDSSCVAPQAKLAHATEHPGKVRGKMVDDRYPEKNEQYHTKLSHFGPNVR